MAKIEIACPDCNIRITCDVDQSICNNGDLVWFMSIYCTHCDCAIEEDGSGWPPEQYRNAIIHDEGLWQLSVLSEKNKVVSLAKVLREKLDFDIKQAINTSKKIPGGILTGTRTEMEWLCKHIVDAGLIASICPKTQNSLRVIKPKD